MLFDKHHTLEAQLMSTFAPGRIFLFDSSHSSFLAYCLPTEARIIACTCVCTNEYTCVYKVTHAF